LLRPLTRAFKGIILHPEQINNYLIVEIFKRRKNEMKKTYPIEVDCANCANLMEEATKKTAGVKSAVVNFMTQKMTVEFEEGQDAGTVMKNVLKACKKVEPDCEIQL
jgi:copper chaperone CopZ